MLSRRAEDYLEAIINIAEQKGVVRVKDLAKALGVKPSSVVSMVRRLNDMGLVEYRKHDGIWLTEQGAEIGKSSWSATQQSADYLKSCSFLPKLRTMTLA